MRQQQSSLFFFLNDPATTEIYTLSLHDALPISADPVHACDGERAAHAASDRAAVDQQVLHSRPQAGKIRSGVRSTLDRKSTRLNSSHQIISYAVFCLKKKKQDSTTSTLTHSDAH